MKSAFDAELARSDELVSKVLATSPNDANALFSRVLANGLRGDYTAMIEKRNLASLGYMKTSRVTAQQLLAVDPTCYDAFLAIGVENYLLGSTPAPVRWVLSITGSQTDKQEGIKRLRLTAEKGYYLAPFARLLLAVAALRDKDKNTARVAFSGPGHRVSPQPALLQGTRPYPIAISPPESLPCGSLDAPSRRIPPSACNSVPLQHRVNRRCTNIQCASGKRRF